MPVQKVCEHCGKTFEVIPCRAEKAKYCCRACSDASKKAENNVVCTQCGKPFHMKKYQMEKYNRNHGFFCCKECYSKFQETAMLGEGNHQFGLKGELNSSFKRGLTTRKNGSLTEQYIYTGERPDADRNWRMTMHRYNVVTNPDKFHPSLFIKDKDLYILKPNLQVHHKDWDHDNNDISNLTVLTRQIHTQVHNQIKEVSIELISKIIGVLKGSELLESLVVGNQQPSLSSNTFEGSETNNRVQTGNAEDSNIDTSALLNQIIKLINDYIVQTSTITNDGYEKTIAEMLESEIKNSEKITNGL